MSAKGLRFPRAVCSLIYMSTTHRPTFLPTLPASNVLTLSIIRDRIADMASAKRLPTGQFISAADQRTLYALADALARTFVEYREDQAPEYAAAAVLDRFDTALAQF